jgi:hypothetical protein
MITLAIGTLLILTAATGAALLLRPQGGVSFLLAVAALGFAEVVAVSYGLSLFDAYERAWFTAALGVVAGSVVVATMVVRPPLPRPAVTRAARDLVGDPLLVVLAGVVIVELSYLLAVALFTPPNDLDALTYHLTRALFWIQQGSVAPIADTTDTRINDFPPNAEILQGATMLLSDSVRWVGLVQFASLLLTMLGIYGIGCRIGLDRRGAMFGALLFPTLPVVALQASTPMNDLVVAALVTTAVFFALGRSTGELALACLTVALLIGTKVTGLLALPVLLAVAVLAHRGRRLALVVAGGVVGVLAGSLWYAVNLLDDNFVFGANGRTYFGSDDGVLAIAARITRRAVEAFELPGAPGRDRLLYLLAAGVVAIAALVLRRPSVAVVGAALTALPLLVLPAERVLHSVYWHGWELVGYDEAVDLGPSRDSTLASQGESWYGPVGLAMTLVALALTAYGARKGRLPWIAFVLALAPIVLVVGSSATVGYHSLSGRYAMGGVALSAATWGLVRRSTAGSAAIVAAAATTVLLSLVNWAEKPAGIELLETTGRPSVWTMSRAEVQNRQPELMPVTKYVDDHAVDGSTIGLTRDAWVLPFVYAGFPDITHRLVYADTLAEATRRDADWAVLPLAPRCGIGWRLELRSPPWAVYRQVAGASCR